MGAFPCTPGWWCGSAGSVVGPIAVLQDDAISVAILERDAVHVPKGIEGSHRRKTVLPHPQDSGLPISPIGKVEDEEVVFARSPPSVMAVRPCEFKVIRFSGAAEHDAVEPVVVFKAIELAETKAISIKHHHRVQIIGGPRDTKQRLRFH